MLGFGLSIGPHCGVLSYSDGAVRGCGQTGLRRLQIKLCSIDGCV